MTAQRYINYAGIESVQNKHPQTFFESIYLDFDIMENYDLHVYFIKN